MLRRTRRRRSLTCFAKTMLRMHCVVVKNRAIHSCVSKLDNATCGGVVDLVESMRSKRQISQRFHVFYPVTYICCTREGRVAQPRSAHPLTIGRSESTFHY